MLMVECFRAELFLASRMFMVLVRFRVVWCFSHVFECLRVVVFSC